MNKAKSAHPILVAVRKVDRSARATLRKAALLAKLYDAPLRIVHVLAIPQGSLARAGGAVRQAAQADLDERAAGLEKLAGLAELRGLQISTTVRCDYPVQDALVREAFDCHARMLVVQSREPGRLARLFLSNIDWELIRNCPCPLWLSKSDKFDRRAPVLAAVDPLHANAKPAMLDERIIQQAVAAAGERPDKVLLCHAYNLAEPVLIDTPEIYWFAMSEQSRQVYEQNIDSAMGKLRKKREIPEENAIVVRGDPAVQLPRLAKKHAASLVVMGAVSRRGLKRVFIGNTAERVLDKLGCDVLVVKPRGFKSPVERHSYRQRVQRPRRKTAAARASRRATEGAGSEGARPVV